MSARRGLLFAAAAAALLALAARPAVATACGSSGGSSSSSGGSSSSSGGSSSSSGGSSSSSDSTPACVDTTEIVGRTECSSFGAWDSGDYPRLRISLGTSFHSFPVSGYHFAGTASHEKDIAYRLTGEEIGDPHGFGGTLDLQITGLIGKRFYLGVEGSIGGAGLSGARPMSRPDLELSPSGGLLADAGAVGGLLLPVGDFTAAAELFVGYRLLGLGVHSQHLACESDSMAFDGGALIQPRIKLSRWLTPWLSAGASVGSDPLRRGDLSVGISLEGHMRAFDALRSR